MTKSSPIISIITVTYNCEKVIESTIQSILNQEKAEVEYIIIDGKSTDGTVKIIEKYKAKIDYFISEEDKGIYDAMNKGLQIATGNYVLFINAGDMLFDNRTIHNLYKIIQPNHPDIVYGETMLINEKGENVGTRSENSSRKLPEQLNWKSLQKGMVVSHQSFLVKKAIAPLYDLQYTSSSDVDWVINCLKKAKTIVNANTIISKYLIGGYSKKTLDTSLKERFKILNKHYGIISNFFSHFIITLRAIAYKIKRKPLN